MKLISNQFYVGPVAGSSPPRSNPQVLQDSPNFPGGTGSWACRTFGTSVAALIPTSPIPRPFRIFGWSVTLAMTVDGATSPTVPPTEYGSFGKLWAGIQNETDIPPTSQGQDSLVLPRDMSTMQVIWDGGNDDTPQSASGPGGQGAAPILATYQLPSPIPVSDAEDQFTFALVLTPSITNCVITVWKANYSVQYDEGDGST